MRELTNKETTEVAGSHPALLFAAGWFLGTYGEDIVDGLIDGVKEEAGKD